MTKVALRGIGARKLRAFTTWLAIFLGVALVAGTYVLTDTINKSFGEIFSESLKGTDVAITAQTGRRRRRTPRRPPSRRACSTGCARWTAWRPPRAPCSRRDASWTRRATRSGTASRPNFISSLNPPRFETLDYVEGRKPRTRLRGVDRHADGRHRRPEGRRRSCGWRARTRRRPTASSGSRSSATRASAAPASPRCCCPRRSGSPIAMGQFDQISVAAADGVTPEQLRDRIAKVMPHQVHVETGDAGGASGRRATSRSNLSFLRIALLVFAGRVAVRRRVPDLQHVLDHRRPAHARVRDAAHARAPRARQILVVGRARGAHARACSARPPGSPAGSASRTGSTSSSRRSGSTCRTPAP